MVNNQRLLITPTIMRTEDEVVPRLLVSTHRQKRPFNIIDIADDIDWLSNHLGGLSSVSVLLGVSTGMLNQFLRVRKLTSKAQALVKNRDIDSVTAVHNLAKFSAEDQDEIAHQISQGLLNYLDIRLLSPLRKQFSDASVKVIIQKLKNSENQKVSVIQFPADTIHKDIEEVRRELSEIIGSSEIIDLVLNNDVGVIKITPKGEQALRKAARRRKKTLQEFTYAMLK